MLNRMNPDDDRIRNLFEGYSGPTNPADIKRITKVATRLAIFALIIAVFLAIAGPYAEWLWYQHDARRPEVLLIAYRARGILFSISFAVIGPLLWFNIRRALATSLVMFGRPGSVTQVIGTKAIAGLQDIGPTVIKFAAPLLAFFMALGFSNEWSSWLLASHAQSFGRKDPTFGLDIGFFVFQLPWYKALAGFALSTTAIITLATIGVYVLLQSLAAMAKIELGRPKIRSHISILVGVTLIALGIQIGLNSFEVGLTEGSQFTGGGYAAMQGLAAQQFACLVAILAGVATIINSRIGRPFAAPAVGAIALVLVYVLGVGIYPGLIQRVSVDPDRLAKEAPYAKRAIEMTRFGFGLDAVSLTDLEVDSEPTAAQITAAKPTLDNMRLWDPELLRQGLESIQGIRPYYSFHDVDVDRYLVDGKPTVLMIAPRDLNLDGLDSAARNWTNERLRYTHGYGVTISQVDGATAEGEPIFLAKDIPQKSPTGIAVTEPRLYFSDARTAANGFVDEYAIVDTGEEEFDYPAPDGASHRWKGDRGIPIGGPLARLAYSVSLGDGNLLVSPKVTSKSRLLVHRNVLDRARRVLPFLKFDSDPYLVVLKGRLIWVLDGYTTSNMVPYSALIGSGESEINYIRNSVKATVDAYSGEMHAYAMQNNEPILEAYRGIYPGLLEEKSTMPEGLVAHLRYPEDLFSLQSVMLTLYHVSDPATFLSNGDAWNIARERGINGSSEPIRPYFVMIQLPDQPKPGFYLIRPFTPNGKPNMIGWMAAHCDPGSYGQLSMYRWAKGSPLAGPEQMEAKFNSTPDISNINRQFNNDQSEVVVGNLLAIPIGKSVLYAESLFLRSKSSGIQAYPRLTKVILAFNDRVVVSDTYQDALKKLLGGSAPVDMATVKPDAKPGSDSVGPLNRQSVQETLSLLDQANAALKGGDFAKYGELQKQVRNRLSELAK